MDGRSGGWRRRGRGRGRWLGVFLALLAAEGLDATGPRRGEASPIRSIRVVTSDTEASLGPDWARFLTGGPLFWSVEPPPPFPSGLALQTINGQTVRTPFVEYLIWRRGEDSVRFDQYHPLIAPQLGNLYVPPRTPTNPPFNPQPQLPQIPEPGGLAIALMMVVATAGWWSRRPLRAGGQD